MELRPLSPIGKELKELIEAWIRSKCPGLAGTALQWVQNATSARKPREVKGDITLTVTPCIGSFVTFNKSFCEDLSCMKTDIVNYISHPSGGREGRRPKNFLLLGPPGSGKSFLIGQLTEEVGQALGGHPAIHGESFNVSEWDSFKDVERVLKLIHIANRYEGVPIVFVDEVDTRIGGEHVFKKLIGPMWDGTYQGQDMKRAVIFYAMSMRLATMPAADIGGLPYMTWKQQCADRIGVAARESKVHKLLDFYDRIENIICIPPTNNKLIDYSEDAVSGGVHPILRASADDWEIGIENMVLANIIVTQRFKHVKRIDLPSVCILAKIVQEGLSKRDAISIVRRSTPPTGSDFEIDMLPTDVVSDDKKREIQESFKEYMPYISMTVDAA